MTRTRSAAALLLFASYGLTMLGCSSDGGSDIIDPPAEVRATCADCHTSEVSLKATVLPDPPDPESTGEG